MKINPEIVEAQFSQAHAHASEHGLAELKDFMENGPNKESFNYDVSQCLAKSKEACKLLNTSAAVLSLMSGTPGFTAMLCGFAQSFFEIGWKSAVATMEVEGLEKCLFSTEKNTER